MQPINNLSVIDSMPARKAVILNVIPATMAMLMQLIYNLADTFFIGQTHNDLQVAAVSIAMPVFMIFMALGTVFGIGGTSVISRALGEGRTDYVKKVSSFCMWASVAVGVAITSGFYIFMDDLLRAMGANADILGYTRSYLIIVAMSGPLVLFSGTFSNTIRAEGQPTRAMAGMLLGNITNIILDPIMILALGWGIKGAAIATVIGNTVGAMYYLLYFERRPSMLSISPRDFAVNDKVATGVLSIGIPAALGPLFMSLSQVIMNSVMAGYGSLAVAAAGVSAKVTMIIGTIAMGIGQGVQPLLGYSIGTQNLKRYKALMKSSIVFALSICLFMTLLCYIFAKSIISVFLTEPDSFNYGVKFAYILQSTAFMFGIFFCFVNALQAMGAALSSLIVNVSRQGLIYIPALFILKGLLGMEGLIWAQPIADIFSLFLAIVLHTYAYKRISDSFKQDLEISAKKV